MATITIEIMLILFLARTVSSVALWGRTGQTRFMMHAIIFCGGAIFYVWLQTPYYEPGLGRWFIRVLLATWVIPGLLLDIEKLNEKEEER